MSDCYSLYLPVSSRIGGDSPCLVLPASPIHLRKNVERLAYYFKREMNYDHVQFEASESPNYGSVRPYHVYLFHELARDLLEENTPAKQRIFGACCFRWREWDDAQASWSLDWIWFHPFFRGRGHLAKAWPFFEESHGQFHIEEPLSCGMHAFLDKVGWRRPEI